MTDRKHRIPPGMKRLTVTVPETVADYYEQRGLSYGTSTSSAAAPVLCAMARGEIRQGFTQQPGGDMRPR